MDNKSVKIKKIYIENIKNVRKGTIDFTDEENQLNILGIYGQNGSGKTALVDALTTIKALMLGEQLNHGEIDLLNDELISKIDILIVNNNEYEVNYVVEIKKDNDKVKVISEKIFQKKLQKYQRVKSVFYYKTGENSIDIDLFGTIPVSDYSENDKVNLLTAEALAIENRTSFLFSKRIEEFIKNPEKKDAIQESLSQAYTFLKDDFAKHLFIYSNQLSGMIYAEIFLPISFQVDNISGLVPIPMDSSKDIPEHLYSTAELIFDQINQVLPNLIPNLTIDLRLEEMTESTDGDNEYKVSVDSVRQGKAIPFRKESDGIKKIVSILSTLINVYNSKNIIAVVDELDAGIFEFLLGEIVEILSDDAKGQLIFTSHNLRALEVLPYKKIVFTTTNPEKRYIKVSNVKSTNNLRDMYIRSIQLGGMEEEVYSETDSYLIKKSFRKALKSSEVIEKNI